MGTGSPGKRWAGREAMWADEKHASELLEIWGQAAQASGGTGREAMWAEERHAVSN
jgi:hypothetical protein